MLTGAEKSYMSGELGYQFVDTNVLVYAHDLSAGAKAERAQALLRALWESQRGCLSIQVVQEFYVTITRKLPRHVPPEVAVQIIVDLSAWKIHSPQMDDIVKAIEIQLRYRISFWDALIVQSAERMGCEVIWSEDLNPGQRYNGVQVMDPFMA
jgi:predicted nucleic acid-binding protein